MLFYLPLAPLGEQRHGFVVQVDQGGQGGVVAGLVAQVDEPLHERLKSFDAVCSGWRLSGRAVHLGAVPRL